ncbi:MAG TPA: response regulator transcription factor [Chloroflexia bacterium]|nr:response regulator transcription factor [Chloroflexia bacterium]
MDARQTVLIVDDNLTLLNMMRDFLEAAGFQVEMALDGERALAILDQKSIQCLLLDVMMPGLSGFELCRQIREASEVPILFLSARDGDYDKIRGLGLGGDDYIVKSATPGEVVARVQAVLRRYKNGVSAPAAVLDFGRLVIDLRAHEIRVAGQAVDFTAREFELLHWLVEHPRQVFTHEQLFQRFWGEVGDRHTVAVHIERIRKKIEENPNKPRYLLTVWGVGYRFEGIKR